MTWELFSFIWRPVFDHRARTLPFYCWQVLFHKYSFAGLHFQLACLLDVATLDPQRLQGTRRSWRMAGKGTWFTRENEILDDGWWVQQRPPGKLRSLNTAGEVNRGHQGNSGLRVRPRGQQRSPGNLRSWRTHQTEIFVHSKRGQQRSPGSEASAV